MYYYYIVAGIFSEGGPDRSGCKPLLPTIIANIKPSVRIELEEGKTLTSITPCLHLFIGFI